MCRLVKIYLSAQINLMSDKQNQESGDNSTNIQSGSIVIYNGVTYEDVRKIALDVAKGVFYELSTAAKKTAMERVNEITDAVIKKIQKENPQGILKAEDPAFQYDLFIVQKEYAKTGDRDLGGLLVDLLVDRSKHEQRNIIQIVLSESLSVAPKLTSDQLATLAIIFGFKYSQATSAVNYDGLGAYLDACVQPFIENLIKRDTGYQHLEFAGCGSIDIRQSLLEELFSNNYRGLFLNGSDREYVEREFKFGLEKEFFINCLSDQSKIQLKFLNKQFMDISLGSSGLNSEESMKIISLFEKTKMNLEDVKKKVVLIRPYMQKLFDIWNNSLLKNFTLTSVGIAIGHANIKRLRGQFADLSIWIN